MEVTPDDVLAVVSDVPQTVGALGEALIARTGGVPGDAGAPVGQRLASAGLSLSALQATVDAMVSAGAVEQVRGKDLWDRGLPTAGTKAMGRYYLAVPR